MFTGEAASSQLESSLAQGRQRCLLGSIPTTAGSPHNSGLTHVQHTPPPRVRHTESNKFNPDPGLPGDKDDLGR